MSEDLTKISLAHELALPETIILDEDVSWGDAFFVGPGYGVIGCVSDGTLTCVFFGRVAHEEISSESDIMHFWNLENQQHLHCVSVTDPDEEIEDYPVFSFNRTQKAPTVPMMASATKLGVVKIWTSPRSEKNRKPQDVTETSIKEIEVCSFRASGLHSEMNSRHAGHRRGNAIGKQPYTNVQSTDWYHRRAC